jgi:hypothetical protein
MKTVLGLYIASRHSEFSLIDPTLQQMLGRSTTNIRDLIAQRLASSAS